MTTRRTFNSALSALAVATLAIGAALVPATGMAQSYPTKPITLIVSYPPGGDTDSLARVFGEKLSARLGQPVVVENRPGASGTIGNSFVAKAAADGHTLLFTPNTVSIATLVLKSGSGASYDVLSDFTPIIQIGTQSLFLVTTAASGVTNVKELLASVKAGKIGTYATPGSGSPMHILGELFNSSAGVKVSQVPYRGSAPAVIDMVGGHIPMMYTTLGPVLQHVNAGKIKVLGVADPVRSSFYPDAPTFAEAGVPNADVGAWQGIMGPKGMPADVVKTLNSHLNDILKMPDVLEKMKTFTTVPTGGDPSVLGKRNAADYARYGKIIKDFGIQAQ